MAYGSHISELRERVPPAIHIHAVEYRVVLKPRRAKCAKPRRPKKKSKSDAGKKQPNRVPSIESLKPDSKGNHPFGVPFWPGAILFILARKSCGKNGVSSLFGGRAQVKKDPWQPSLMSIVEWRQVKTKSGCRKHGLPKNKQSAGT